MSNIYIQEPPTSGKVLMKTTVGDIDIELWCKECPKACKNFIQLCLEGYYNDLTFHRVVKGFIVQGGCPIGDGTGGESIYGHPFKDEFHSRLRYTRRGLVGMANSDKNDNASQFFFTMAATPELQNKNTLFGKVAGDTVFNMLKLEESLVDQNEKPLHPQRILRTEILTNPFDDIKPRIKESSIKEKMTKKIKKGVKKFELLSFGFEAEEDEQQSIKFIDTHSTKSKSSHDILNDPKLSKTSIEINTTSIAYTSDDENTKKKDLGLERIKEKLKLKSNNIDKEKAYKSSSDEEDYLKTVDEENMKKQKERIKSLQASIMNLKKEYKQNKKVKDDMKEKDETNKLYTESNNKLTREYIKEQEKYSEKQKKCIPTNNSDREAQTLKLLQKFREKLVTIKTSDNQFDSGDNQISSEKLEDEIGSDNWLNHKLTFKNDITPILAKDASTKNDDWYDAYDPRNTLNKRKRGEPDTTKGIKKNK